MSDCVNCLELSKNRDLRRVIFERFRWDFPFETLQSYCQFCCVLISHDPSCLNSVLETCIDNFIQLSNKTNKFNPKDKGILLFVCLFVFLFVFLFCCFVVLTTRV